MAKSKTGAETGAETGAVAEGKTKAKPGEAWPSNFAALYLAAANGKTHTPAEFCAAYHHTHEGSDKAIANLHQTVGGLNRKLASMGRPPLPKLKRASKSGSGRIADFIALMDAANVPTDTPETAGA